MGVFPEFPRERVILSHNGYNQDVFGVRVVSRNAGDPPTEPSTVN